MINSNEKRFSLSREGFGKKRMAIIKNAFKESHEIHKEISSFTIFGSTVKGQEIYQRTLDSGEIIEKKFREESDIDGCLYVDIEEIKDFDSEHDLWRGMSNLNIVFKEHIEEKYKEVFVNKLAKKGLSNRQIGTIAIRPISKEIVDIYLERIKNKLDSVGYEPTEKPKLIHGSNLHTMFHLEIGGGIRKYRKYLLNELKNMGEEGEKIWGEIIGTTEYFEQNFNKNTEKRYPRNLLEAIEKYGS